MSLIRAYTIHKGQVNATKCGCYIPLEWNWRHPNPYFCLIKHILIIVHVNSRFLFPFFLNGIYIEEN